MRRWFFGQLHRCSSNNFAKESRYVSVGMQIKFGSLRLKLPIKSQNIWRRLAFACVAPAILAIFLRPSFVIKARSFSRLVVGRKKERQNPASCWATRELRRSRLPFTLDRPQRAPVVVVFQTLYYSPWRTKNVLFLPVKSLISFRSSRTMQPSLVLNTGTWIRLFLVAFPLCIRVLVRVSFVRLSAAVKSLIENCAFFISTVQNQTP